MGYYLGPIQQLKDKILFEVQKLVLQLLDRAQVIAHEVVRDELVLLKTETQTKPAYMLESLVRALYKQADWSIALNYLGKSKMMKECPRLAP